MASSLVQSLIHNISSMEKVSKTASWPFRRKIINLQRVMRNYQNFGKVTHLFTKPTFSYSILFYTFSFNSIPN